MLAHLKGVMDILFFPNSIVYVLVTCCDFVDTVLRKAQCAIPAMLDFVLRLSLGQLNVGFGEQNF